MVRRFIICILKDMKNKDLLEMGCSKISLYIFIDAFGWELLKQNEWFLSDIIKEKNPIRTVFGYSCACVPSIITGKTPSEHGHWGSFYYSQEGSVFKNLNWLRIFPSAVMDSSRARTWVSRFIKRVYGFAGYFSLYNTPFKYLPYFDYQEKNDIFAEGGIEGSETVFDRLRKRGIPFLVGKGDSDGQKFDQLKSALNKREIELAYLHLGDLDALLHGNRKDSDELRQRIKGYNRQIRDVYELAMNSYDEVELNVFSDHGMKEVSSSYDLMGDIESLGLVFGKDYVVYYDSTMARFWFLNDFARLKITDKLKEVKEGKILSDEELKEVGVYFDDHKYGEVIFLMDPGTLIVPSFMGRKSIVGMHGYHPNDPDSMAMWLTNVPREDRICNIMDIFSPILNEE